MFAFFYNKSLQDKIDHYNETKETINPTPAQYKNEYVFLKEIDSLALANAQLARETAYKNFFSKRSQFPKFKSKRTINHIQQTTKAEPLKSLIMEGISPFLNVKE